MMLTHEEKLFISRRERLNRLWPIVAVMLIMAMGGLFAWLLGTAPWLVNPYFVAEMLKSGKMPPSTVTFMAMLCPVFGAMCFLMVIILIIYGWGWMGMEKKYIGLINRMDQLGSL